MALFFVKYRWTLGSIVITTDYIYFVLARRTEILSTSPNIETEQQLIQQYQATGNQAFVGKLFSPYMGLLYGVCLKYLKDQHRAEDAVMDIYVLVSKKLKTHQVEAFRPWLYVVAKNNCFEKLRKANTQQQKEKQAFTVYSETIFHPDYESKEKDLERMEACMEALNEEQKRCISAFYYQSKTYQDIADIFDLPWNRVRSHIQNGRLKLKKCIEATSKTNV